MSGALPSARAASPTGLSPYGSSQSGITNAIYRAYWTAEEDAELRLYWSAGYTSTQIARLMDRTRGSVLGRVHRHRMTRNEFARRKPQRVAEEQGRLAKVLAQKASIEARRSPVGGPCGRCGVREDKHSEFGCSHYAGAVAC